MTTLVTRNVKGATVAPIVEISQSLVFGGSMKLGGRYVGRLSRNLASVAVRMFTYLIYFVKKM